MKPGNVSTWATSIINSQELIKDEVDKYIKKKPYTRVKRVDGRLTEVEQKL